MVDKDMPVLDVDYHLREYDETAEQIRKRLVEGPGGIMDMKQTIANKESEISLLQSDNERLRDKCDRQAMILRRLNPEMFPDTFFITSHSGEKDQNGMPERLYVVPAYGVDFSYVYERTARTTGPEW